MNLFDQIWSRIVKISAFALGMWIMYHEAFQDHSDRPYLYAAAIGMMGLQVAESVEKLLDIVSTVLSGLGEKRKLRQGPSPSEEDRK